MPRFMSLRESFDPQAFLAVTGFFFRGLTVSATGNKFNVILRSTNQQGQGFYAMTVCDHPYDGLQALCQALSYGNGDSVWVKDKFFNGGAKG